jgi:hypothetical protein
MEQLVNDTWRPFSEKRNCIIAMMPLDVNTNTASIAKWSNLDVPNDKVSIENAAITDIYHHWPLFIDPKCQGIQLIRNFKEFNNLKVLRFCQHNFVALISNVIESGDSVLINNFSDSFRNL